MNIPQYALENKKVIYFFLLVLMIGGVISFFDLPKKEDSPFIIKTAVLITQYPGATPQEVEELITEPIEREIQSMSEVHQIKSDSRFGISKISVELDPTIPPDRMPNKWDELRRKVANIQASLPSGASTIRVNDDFGDVYGIYYAIVMDKGFEFNELRKYAQLIKTELSPLKGVQKIFLFGEQQENIEIQFSLSTLSNMGIDPNNIRNVLQTQNTLTSTGELNAGNYQIKVMADGTYKSVEDIKNQVILSKDGKELKLRDIAKIEQTYLNPPSVLMRVNGKPAIGIGVASGANDNVVAVGEKVKTQLDQLLTRLPLGIEIIPLYPEDKIAHEANNGFIINLIESLLIVIVVIFLVMGVRAGLLIGSSLLFAIGGTMLIMLLFNVGLNRTSLAAFIIAMGMLVDNAIVVTDNAQIGIKRGLPRYKALLEGATIPQWGLLGATAIAIFSFLPLYLAPAAVAEIVKPLFVVLAVSLGLSWVLALTQTTTFGNFILKENKGGANSDPYDTKFYHRFEDFLSKLIKKRVFTLLIVVGVLVFSLGIMAVMPQSFFPLMDKPYMRGDLIFPEGTSIKQVEQQVKRVEDYLAKDPRVKQYCFTLGSSPMRYYLASASYGPMPNYANVMVETHLSKDSPAVEEDFYQYMIANYPDIITRSALFALSPVPEAKIEIGYIGHNIDTLAHLVNNLMGIAQKDSMVIDVRNSWGTKIPLITPLYVQERALRLGITRQQFTNALRLATNGIPLGEYRQGDQFMPILMKNIDAANFGANELKTLPVYSAKSSTVTVDQIAENFDLTYHYNIIRRIDRERIMMMQCDPQRYANENAAFKNLYDNIKFQTTTPDGYKLLYQGNQEQQDKSNAALADKLPLTFLLIYVTLLFLFPANYRKPVIIMVMLPLIFIGVVWGLIIFGKSLDFFAILGLLGLIGMNIKNAIVLVDQINIEQKSGLTPLQAVIQATKTRIIPVVMASGTTILGMLPLLGDAMFAGMAATIMGGLFMATILTILVLPVTYCVFFKIKE